MKNVMHKLETLLEYGGTKRDILFLVLSGIALLVSILKVPLPFDSAWIAIVLCGIPIILEAVIGLVTEFDITADVLVSLALIASVLIGENFAAGEVAFIMQLGGLLEELTVARARAGIEKLVHLTPQTGRVLRNGGEEIIPAEQIQPGDRLRVLPGETIPVDGVILSGQTAVNQAVMTGESLPVDKGVGDAVSSGTVNQFGAFEMEAVRVGEDSSIQRMIRLVQSADAGKAKIVRLADRWAVWIVVTALTAAVLTWAVTGEIIRSVTILVVFCPCSLVLATPTAIMAAIGNATKHGFLVREGDALERLARVQRAAFDKTGTLTYGTPEVVAVTAADGFDGTRLLQETAALEKLSEHPLGKAVVKSAGDAVLPEVQDFRMLPGQGVSGSIAGRKLLAGNEKLLKAEGISLSNSMKDRAAVYLAQGATLIYVAENGVLSGFIALADTLRPESPAVMDALKTLQVEPMLLTGDHANAADAIAGRCHIERVQADCLPEDKLAALRASQSEGKLVLMLGDGINDAPALKAADVGIAMGGIGSDIAVDAADIALVNDKLEELPHLVALSHRMMRTIRINLSFSMALNFVAIVLAITGILNPVVGALVHNTGSVLVITSSALLLNWRRKA